MTASLKFNQPYPPAQARTIRLALEAGLVSDKAQARAEGVSPRSINDRWAAIADTLGLGFGQRDRAQVIAALFVRRHIEVAAALLIALILGTGVSGKQDVIRPIRGSRPVKTAAAFRRDVGDFAYSPITTQWSV